MKSRLLSSIATTTAVVIAAPAIAGGGSWVTFEDETDARVVAAANLVAGDLEEKDYAWADLDGDGDTDLVVVRKQPFSTPGRKRNVLLMNEGTDEGHAMNGMLVDRTVEYMTDADDGGNGFLDETNDRDVTIADVDMDGWLDVITSTAYGQGLAKTISHSRVYMNKGDDAGVWQGFRYEESRTPLLSEAPNTCGVAAGDVTGDGYPDLYYVTYNSTSLEDHLLVNDGTGFFANETATRLTSAMIQSAFGTATEIADMNADGWNDIVKSENGPVKIIYNGGNGFFDDFETTSSGSHYHMSLGELNGDGLLDIIISDDGADRYSLNQGTGGDGRADFIASTFDYVGGSNDDGFGSNSVTADLDNDGWNDVLIADVDVDIGGCNRRTHIFRNLGNPPSVTLQEQQIGTEIVGIPTTMLRGTHDIAVFDIDGDGWRDLVIGRCTGTQIWMNQPPLGLAFSYPDDLPDLVSPGEDVDVTVAITSIGGALPEPGTETLHVAANGSVFVEVPMENVSPGMYTATLPASACADRLDYYFSAEAQGAGVFVDPVGAPVDTFRSLVASGTEMLLRDEIEGDVSAWIVQNDASLTAGAWEQADPNGTIFNGDLAAPDDDATDGVNNVLAFVTENGLPGGAATLTDIDGGPTVLITPSFAVATDAVVSYARWMYSTTGVPDLLTVDVSGDDGATWTPVPDQTTGDTGAAWEAASFLVGNYTAPTTTMRVRFTVGDNPNDSVTEAGIDDFQVDVLTCGSCPADLDGDGAVDVTDLLTVLANWGTGGAGADLAVPSDTVDVADMLVVLASWGACP